MRRKTMNEIYKKSLYIWLDLMTEEFNTGSEFLYRGEYLEKMFLASRIIYNKIKDNDKTPIDYLFKLELDLDLKLSEAEYLDNRILEEQKVVHEQ